MGSQCAVSELNMCQKVSSSSPESVLRSVSSSPPASAGRRRRSSSKEATGAISIFASPGRSPASPGRGRRLSKMKVAQNVEDTIRINKDVIVGQQEAEPVTLSTDAASVPRTPDTVGFGIGLGTSSQELTRADYVTEDTWKSEAVVPCVSSSDSKGVLPCVSSSDLVVSIPSTKASSSASNDGDIVDKERGADADISAYVSALTVSAAYTSQELAEKAEESSAEMLRQFELEEAARQKDSKKIEAAKEEKANKANTTDAETARAAPKKPAPKKPAFQLSRGFTNPFGEQEVAGKNVDDLLTPWKDGMYKYMQQRGDMFGQTKKKKGKVNPLGADIKSPPMSPKGGKKRRSSADMEADIKSPPLSPSVKKNGLLSPGGGRRRASI